MIISRLWSAGSIYLNNNSDWLAYISLTVAFGSLLYATIESFKTSKQLEELKREIVKGFDWVQQKKCCLCNSKKSNQSHKGISFNKSNKETPKTSKKKNNINNKKEDIHNYND